MSHRKSYLLAVALLPAVLLQAQTERPSQPAPEASSKRIGHNDTQGDVKGDAILATMLHVGSNHDVTLAQAALKQAQNPEVRAFAQQMVTDHTAWSSKLQPLTTGAGQGRGSDGSGERGTSDTRENTDPTRGQNPSRDPNQNPSPKDPVEASTRRTASMAGTFDHAALIRELGKKCEASDMKLLTSKSGGDFDRCYMAMQVASHTRAADMIAVFKSYASPAMIPTLDAGEKTIAKHLEHAKSLCKQIEERSDTGVGSDPKVRDGR